MNISTAHRKHGHSPASKAGRFAAMAGFVTLAVLILLGITIAPGITRTVQAAGATPRPSPTRTAVATKSTTSSSPNATPWATPTTRSILTPQPTTTRPAIGSPTPQRTSQPAATSSATGADDGATLYKSFGCAGCHHLTSIGAVGIFGPNHDHIGTNAALRVHQADYTGTATTAEDYIRESILTPHVYQAEQYRRLKYAMPAFPSISESDLDALVKFMLQQK